MRDADVAIFPSELRHVVEDLQGLVGAPVRDAWVPTPTSVVLSVGRRLLLIESWPVPRLHTLARRPPSPATPYSFQGLLRARLAGRVDALRVVGDDRVVELTVGDVVLHARLFGRGGGLWLLAGDRVLAASTGPAPDALPPLPAAPRRQAAPRFAPVQDEDWSDAAERFFTGLVTAREEASVRRRLAAHLGRLRAREERLAANLRDDLAAASRADAVRHQADCLAASLHVVRRGQAEVIVPDVAEPDATVTVRLDPAHPPGWNVARLYERARRLERGASQVRERLATAEAAIGALAAAQASALAGDLSTLRGLAARWSLPDEAPPRAAGPSAPWATWRGPGGEVAWIGRSDTANHALVFRRARGRDWWVHVRDRPGAHVVLPSDRRGTAPPLELLLVAAQLALNAARVPAGERLDVQYARVADLRPVPGAGPGRVAVREERVLHVVSDPSRLDGWSREA
jgi:predicted ribosome quality control (RQC) complex YloA/Tae2 family protein